MARKRKKLPTGAAIGIGIGLGVLGAVGLTTAAWFVVVKRVLRAEFQNATTPEPEGEILEASFQEQTATESPDPFRGGFQF